MNRSKIPVYALVGMLLLAAPAMAAGGGGNEGGVSGAPGTAQSTVTGQPANGYAVKSGTTATQTSSTMPKPLTATTAKPQAKGRGGSGGSANNTGSK